jgi:hypothetical protein
MGPTGMCGYTPEARRAKVSDIRSAYELGQSYAGARGYGQLPPVVVPTGYGPVQPVRVASG